MNRITKLLSVSLIGIAMLGAASSALASGTDIRVYMERPSAEAGNKLYRGAKYEPVVGSYLAMFAEGDEAVHNAWTGNPFYFDGVPALTGRAHALYMVYIPYGKMEFNHYASHYKKAQETSTGMQICLEPLDGLESVKDGEYLRKFARQARDSGIPVFLRFANEMNDGSNPWGNKDPNLYKEKFRLVAKIMHEEAPNVVMCWAPNDWPKNSSDKYYPGDDAVDWVGISAYPPYVSNTKSKHSMKFTDRTKEIYDKYSSRKPVFLSEGAPIQNIEFQDSTSVSYVAAKETKEFYDEVARRYPGIKAVFYWNNDETHGAKRQCKLSDNPTVLSAYKQAISSPFFLSAVGQKSPVYFADVQWNAVSPEKQKLSAFMAIDGRLDIGRVAYKINGRYVGEKTGSPYEISYDFSQFAGQSVEIQADIYTTSNAYVTSKKIAAKVQKEPNLSSGIKATPSVHAVTLNGKTVKILGYSINGHNYYMLRDVADALKNTGAKFDVGYDQKKNEVVIERGVSYSGGNDSKGSLEDNPRVSKSTQSVSIDGSKTDKLDAYLVNQNNYFKLVDLGKTLGFNVEWDGENKTVRISTN